MSQQLNVDQIAQVFKSSKLKNEDMTYDCYSTKWKLFLHIYSILYIQYKLKHRWPVKIKSENNLKQCLNFKLLCDFQFVPKSVIDGKPRILNVIFWLTKKADFLYLYLNASFI